MNKEFNEVFEKADTETKRTMDFMYRQGYPPNFIIKKVEIKIKQTACAIDQEKLEEEQFLKLGFSKERIEILQLAKKGLIPKEILEVYLKEYIHILVLTEKTATELSKENFELRFQLEQFRDIEHKWNSYNEVNKRFMELDHLKFEEKEYPESGEE